MMLLYRTNLSKLGLWRSLSSLERRSLLFWRKICWLPCLQRSEVRIWKPNAYLYVWVGWSYWWNWHKTAVNASKTKYSPCCEICFFTMTNCTTPIMISPASVILTIWKHRDQNTMTSAMIPTKFKKRTTSCSKTPNTRISCINLCNRENRSCCSTYSGWSSRSRRKEKVTDKLQLFFILL